MTAAIVVLCGLIIALALYLLVRSVRKISKGQCCEGCTGCPHTNTCSSYRPEEEKGRDAP